MTDAAALHVRVGGTRNAHASGVPGTAPRPGIGVLHAGSHPDADVPFRPGEEFPFADAAVAALALDDPLDALPLAQLVHLLLECRRVLQPEAVLALTHDSARARDVAGLVGLVAHPAAGANAFRKPARGVVGDPLVSIAIPAFNPRYFAACLASALAQTYANTEVVVCDDCPGGDIEAVVRWLDGNHRVRYLRNATRLRPRGNFIRCLEESRGEFVKFLCDDDLLAPGCVERLLHAFRRAPDVTLATSHRRRIDADGNTLPDQPATLPIVARSSVIAGHSLANAMLMVGLNTVGEPSTALFRKADIADQAGHYFHFRRAPGRGVIDMVLWSALLLKGNAVYLCEDLSAFRIHAEQRQNDPATRSRTIDSIRGLQSAWLELGIDRWLPPHLLVTRDFAADADDWALTPMLGVTAWRVAVDSEAAPQCTGAPDAVTDAAASARS